MEAVLWESLAAELVVGKAAGVKAAGAMAQ